MTKSVAGVIDGDAVAVLGANAGRHPEAG